MIAATVLVRRRDGRMLVVWNRKLRGWVPPGGKVEGSESVVEAAARELEEETGLIVGASDLSSVYAAPPPEAEGSSRPERVYVFRVAAQECGSHAREREVGCPVSWFTRDEFLASCPVREFYEGAFAVIDAADERLAP